MENISNKFSEFFSKITLGKIILIIVILIAVIYIYKQVKKIIKGSKDTPDIAKKDVIESELSYVKTQYSSFADELQSAFRTGLFGMSEDEATIISIFNKMKTNSDVYQLIIAFGSRPSQSVLGYGWSEENLSTQVANYLSSSEIAIINKNFINNGLTFQF